MEASETTISLSDQVPVWLKPDASRRLMKASAVGERRKAKQARRNRANVAATGEQNAHAAEQQPRQLVAAFGDPSNSRARYTLVCRQLITGYFSEVAQPAGSRGLTKNI